MSQNEEERPLLNRRAMLKRSTVAGAALGVIPAAGWLRHADARQESTPEAESHDHASTPVPPVGGTPVTDPLAFGFLTGEELKEPEVRQSENGLLETTLTASLGPAIVAGKEVTTLVYDGSFPGPTLQFKSGDTLKVSLINQLDQMTNLHTHGFHVSPSDNSDNVFVTIDPGAAFDYEYQLPTDHPPGTYWYHPHHHGQTNTQVASGLAGVMLNEGAADLVPELGTYPQRLLAIQATQFDTDGVVLPTSAQSSTTQMHLINGQWQPVIRIRPGEIQYWQIANISSGNIYNLALAGHSLLQIASDGWMSDTPVPFNQILLGPGERAGVLVEGSATPGTYELRNLLWGEEFQFMPDILMATVIVEGDPVTPEPIPEFLMPFEDLSKLEIDRQRSIVFQVGDSSEPDPYRIDGHPFDEDRIDQKVQLNALEEWVLYNTSSEWHPFHIHVNDFQVVAINDEPYTAHGYNDTFLIPAHGSFTMRTRFLDFTGKYVYHCHILYHEDHSMMGTVEVVE